MTVASNCAEFAAQVRERQVEAVADVDPEAGARSGQRRDHADGQFLGGGHARLYDGAQRDRGGKVLHPVHRW